MEEELSTYKRANMAEEEPKEAAELVEAITEAVNVEGEPSNAKLRKMLVYIQINIATIMQYYKTTCHLLSLIYLVSVSLVLFDKPTLL